MVRGGRADVFFARAAVLVEGNSEALALPMFAEVLGLDLDRDGVTILDAGGNAFEYALRVLAAEALNVPTVVTFDTDALSNDPKLVRVAHRLGLVTNAEFRRVQKERPNVADDRRKVLDGAGWIAADRSFEYEVCSHGYTDTAVDAIRKFGKGAALEEFLKKQVLRADAEGIDAFVRQKAHSKCKTVVAEAVSLAASTVRSVPPCYERALREAVRLASS